MTEIKESYNLNDITAIQYMINVEPGKTIHLKGLRKLQNIQML